MGAFCPDDNLGLSGLEKNHSRLDIHSVSDFLPQVSFSTLAQPLRGTSVLQGVLAFKLANSASDPLTGCTLFLLFLHGDLSWKKAISTPLAAPEREGCIMAGGVPAEINVWAMSSAQLFFSFDLREQRTVPNRQPYHSH